MNQINHQDFRLFKNESLSLDFITINIHRITSEQINHLASYLQNLGFNAYQKQLDSNQSRQEINNHNSFDNKFEVYFIFKIPYQKEIIQPQLDKDSKKSKTK
jgi:hypothetical protein